MAHKWGVTNHLLTRMILQVEISKCQESYRKTGNIQSFLKFLGIQSLSGWMIGVYNHLRRKARYLGSITILRRWSFILYTIYQSEVFGQHELAGRGTGMLFDKGWMTISSEDSKKNILLLRWINTRNPLTMKLYDIVAPLRHFKMQKKCTLPTMFFFQRWGSKV